MPPRSLAFFSVLTITQVVPRADPLVQRAQEAEKLDKSLIVS
jgi:hypothetical protein